MLLAFDTATPAVSVALHDGTRVRASWTVTDGRRHGEHLAVGIDAVLAEAGATIGDVDQVAVGVGPGPFTGLRVGLMTARALGSALGIAVHGVCTLDVLADAVPLDVPFMVATDARRKEVYWASYDAAGRRVSGPYVDLPAEVGWSGPAVGAGAALYPDFFPDAHGPLLPDAAVLAELVASGRATLLPADPLYLRRPDAVEPGARKPAMPL